jgi:hypothetical protein
LPELRGAPGSGRPFRPRQRWGIGAQARSRRHPLPLDGCIVTDVTLCSVAGFRVDVVPGSRLSTRSTRSRRMMGLRRAGLPMFVARSRRTHQRNGLAHVPGRDVPDVLTEHGNFQVSSGSASTKQPSSSSSQGRAAGVGLKSVPVFSIACMITASFRARATAARLKPSRFLNASCAGRSRRARASASPWRPQRAGSAAAPS